MGYCLLLNGGLAHKMSTKGSEFKQIAGRHLSMPPTGWIGISPLTLDEAELEGELRRDLGDDVGGDVAGDERRVAHHVVDGVGHLHQLAVGQICKW